jgi:protein-disulfide isomerase
MNKRPLWCLLLIAGLIGCAPKPETPAASAAPAAQAPATPAVAGPPKQSYVHVSPELLARLVRPESPVLGPGSAKVTLVEYLDPACEACRAYSPIVKQIQFLYPQEVRVVVRFAAFHDGSDEAIRLLLAAQRQGKFEPVLAALFEGQDEWAAHHSPDVAKAWTLARAAGLDVARARRDAASAPVTARLTQDAEDLLALQVSQTPTFYVNGKLLVESGAQPLMELVAAEAKAARGPAAN